MIIMPFIQHTPESLLPRSDSKNAATTCKGLTSSGRPCRRSLASSTQSSPSPSPKANRGVVAILPNFNHDNDDAAAAFFCWQHKEQAEKLVDEVKENDKIRIFSLQHRSSIDTLVDRLGVLDVDDGSTVDRSKPRHGSKPVRKETLPQQWQSIQGPLMTVPEDRPPGHPPRKPRTQSRHGSRDESNLLSLLCCVQPAEHDHIQAPRIRYHEKSSTKQDMVERLGASHSISTPFGVSSQPPVRVTAGSSQSRPKYREVDHEERPTGNRPALTRDPSSQTQDLLALIPRTLSPQTTSLLLGELAKPISPFDQDGGWIYIFWLTPTTSEIPRDSFASSLLEPPSESTRHGRRTSDLLQDFSAASITSAKPSAQKTILLKIGRASNVQRRMNEWTRQCNYNLSLVRYYPHLPSSSPASSPSNTNTPRTAPIIPIKVPHVHRVERLIHLELAEKRVKRLCEGCGKEHREWFEVDATRDGVRGVDEVIRRWVKWAEEKA